MGSKSLGILCSDLITGVKEVRPLSSTEYEKYRKAVSSLRQIKDKLNLFQLVYSNFRDYNLTLEHLLKDYYECPTMEWNRMDEMSLEINKGLSNYLSSIKMFLDHSEANLKRRYGKESSRFKEFKSACSDAYDNTFSYKFLYNLRNYIQHCGMPLSSLTIASGILDDEPDKVYYVLELKLNRDVLLKNFKWKKLKPHIKALPTEFDVNPLVLIMNECIADIAFVLVKNELPEAIKCSTYLKKLINETSEINCVPCILNADKLTNSGGTLNIEWFPLHIISMVDYFKNRTHNPLNIPDSSESSIMNKMFLVKKIDKNNRKRNLVKGKNGKLYYIPEKNQTCQKCGGPKGFYFKNKMKITGEQYIAECFGCLKCKGII